MCFEHKDEAEPFGDKLREHLAKFGLRISEAKSRNIAFGRETWRRAKEQGGKPSTFDFLGFTYYCSTTRKRCSGRAGRPVGRGSIISSRT
jgi:RNA-directed DNA polymerase